MKKGLVIGANRDSVHAIKVAQELGVFVIAVDGNPDAEGFKFANKSFHADIMKKEELEKVVRQESPDFVIPVPIGHCLSAMGLVNDTYHLPGVGYTSIINSVDKFLFHKILSEEGLRNINAYLINKEFHIEEHNYQFPMIMKPRFGSGSRDVYVLESESDLRKLLAGRFYDKEDYVLEQMVQGKEYSVDGAVIHGQFYMTLLRKKEITSLPIRQPISSCSVMCDPEEEKLKKNVYDILIKVIRVLKYDNCILNCDLIINEEEVFIIEISPRPSGHYLHDCYVPLTTGIDLIKEYILFLLGENAVFYNNSISKTMIRFFDMEGRVKNIPNRDFVEALIDSSLLWWQCNICLNENLGKVTNGHSIMNRGFFILKGRSEEQLICDCKKILDCFYMRKEE